MVYSAAFMFSWGIDMLGLDIRDIPQHHPQRGRGDSRGIPMDIQFHRLLHLRPALQHAVGDMGESFGHVFVYALYGVICVVAAWFVYKLVPETKGKTLEDMSALWRKRK